MKSLKDISWQVTEEEYRKDPSLSYSTLAKFEKGGFNGLPTLFDKIESPSLTFGSAVDAIITGGTEEFNSRFIVLDLPKVSDEVKAILKELSNTGKKSLNDITDDVILSVVDSRNYHSNWKPETRVKVIREQGTDYYRFFNISKDKTLLSQEEYNDVINAVKALKNSDQTSVYFNDCGTTNIERLYQLKFKAVLKGVPYRIMADEIIVDHTNKKIYPIDLKTSSHFEWDFMESFTQWSYMIQARLYYRVIKANLENDAYFQDFEVDDYRFIVVNKRSLIPLVWKFPYTQYTGELTDNKGNIYRDPFNIGTDLQYYLENKSELPIGVSRIGDNIITNVFPNV